MGKELKNRGGGGRKEGKANGGAPWQQLYISCTREPPALRPALVLELRCPAELALELMSSNAEKVCGAFLAQP